MIVIALGAFLMALPIMVALMFAVFDLGIRGALYVIGICVLVFGCMGAGAWLITLGIPMPWHETSEPMDRTHSAAEAEMLFQMRKDIHRLENELESRLGRMELLEDAVLELRNKQQAEQSGKG